MKLSSWPEIGSDGDVLLMPYVPKGITGYDDDDETISSRHPIKRQNTTKLHRNDGRTPVPSLRFYADTYIITTYYLNDTSVTCIFSYVNYVACLNFQMGSQHA